MAATVALAVVAGALVFTALWWAGRPGFPQFARTADQNVLLITIDTLRADTLSLYGGRASSPNLSALASLGARFDFAHAHAVVTLPSHTSILTGLYPYQHGIRDNSGYRVTTGTETMATLLKEKGYATGAFVAAFPLDSRFGLDSGFDVYDDRFGESRAALEFSFAERPAGDVVAAAREWIGRQSGRWFAWVHVFDPHSPYRPPAPFDAQYAGSPYDGEAAYVDAALGPLLEEVGRRARRKTLVIVTSDHGEGLGDHGEETHGLMAYESTLRVPLVVAQVPQEPGRRQAGFASGAPVFHVDIVPSVLDALGLEVPRDLPGRSLLSVVEGSDPDVEVRAGYFEAMSASLNRGWAPLTGLLTGRQKFVDLPIAELYDLVSDPGERDNLANRDRARRRVAEARLAAFGATAPGERTDEDAEVVARLRALGYVSGTAVRKERYTENDDPKRLIGVDQQIRRGVELVEAGRLPDAAEVYRAILARRPDMILVYRHLGFILWEMGRPDEAIQTLREAMRLGVANEEIRAQLGTYLAEAGSANEAVRLLEMDRDRTTDVETLNALGIAYARAGSRSSALDTFRRVLELDRANAMALQNRGSLFLEAGDLASAREAFESALVVDDRLAAAYTGLGVVELRSGNREAAINRWRRAVELDPSDFNALYNLATELVRSGRLAAARPFLERFVNTAPPAFYGDDIRRFQALLGRM